jgi:hypothetical protein
VIVPVAVQSTGGRGDSDIRERLSPWGKEIDLAPGENPRIEITPAPEDAVKEIEAY